MVPLGAGGVHVRAGVEEDLDDVGIVTGGSRVQRGEAFVVGGVDVGALGE